MPEESTLVLMKPDAMRGGLIGAVMTKLDALGLELVGAKMVRVSRALAEAHYRHLQDKPFFDETVRYLQGEFHGASGVLALVLCGPEAIARVRAVAGATDPRKADPTSLRGAFGRVAETGLMENVLHASTDPAEAAREIRLWFAPEELMQHSHREPQDVR